VTMESPIQFPNRTVSIVTNSFKDHRPMHVWISMLLVNFLINQIALEPYFMKASSTKFQLEDYNMSDERHTNV
jgi:hypothetical protein